MLSKAAAEIPTGEGWHYEPKWDGFRCIVFRDGDQIELASRNERPFTRYFPELLGTAAGIAAAAVRRRRRDRRAGRRRSRARLRRAAAAHPSGRVACASPGGRDAGVVRRLRPAGPRRRLVARSSAWRAPPPADASSWPLPSRRSTCARRTTDAAVAQRWFTEFEGAGLDGVIAKRIGDPYTPDKRTLIKVKHQRTADCVIAGYRIHKDGNGVGSLLLGLYDDEGDLHHVGVVASFTVKRRAELLAELEPLTHNALDNHPWRDWAEWMTRAEESGTRMPGAGSRWNAGKDLSWVPLRIERVAEVTFGQLQEGRFRHGSQFVRWRPDREPESCRYDQLEVASPVAVRRRRRPGVAS